MGDHVQPFPQTVETGRDIKQVKPKVVMFALLPAGSNPKREATS